MELEDKAKKQRNGSEKPRESRDNRENRDNGRRAAHEESKETMQQI